MKLNQTPLQKYQLIHRYHISKQFAGILNFKIKAAMSVKTEMLAKRVNSDENGQPQQ